MQLEPAWPLCEYILAFTTRIADIRIMPKKSGALQPRKQPRQQRSAVMVELILQAAARVLERESLAGFNTNRVAEIAGISVGSLYQYFPNKDALVTMLITRAQASLGTALAEVIDASSGASLAGALRAIAALAVAQQFGNPVLAAALDHEEQRLPLGREFTQTGAAMLQTVRSLLNRYRRDLARGLPSAAAQDCFVIAKALVESCAREDKRPPPDLEERIVRALLGYLTVKLPARAR